MDNVRACLKEVTLHDRYRIEEVLGYGGFAITYRATDLSSQTPVAVKEYFPKSECKRFSGDTRITCTGDAEFYRKNKERFYQEARMLRELDEIDEVVSVIDCFEENGTVYIVMEYVRGRTLSACVREQGVFEWEVFRDILKDIVRTVIRIHEKGLIHRDLSPENLMLLADGSVKLLDFGAVKEVGTEVEIGDALTRATEAIVKKGFAPVEQYQNWGNLGPWTDVYGLCATVHFCLTGKPLPDALDRVLGVEEQEADGEPADWPVGDEQDAECRIPEYVRNAIEQGTQVRIADRPRSMEELYRLLFPEEKSERRAKKRHAGRKLYLPLGIAAALTFGAVWFWTNCVHVRLRQGDDIQAYLDKAYVRQVTVPKGVTADPATLSVKKKIVIEEGGVLAPGALMVEEGGSIRAEGRLALENSAVSIRREGSCVEVREGGVLSENENTLYLSGGGRSFLYAKEDEGQALRDSRVVGTDEDTLFADAVSVTSYEELAEWCNRGRAISIDADIDIAENTYINTPIRISEGVTVSCREGEWFIVAEGVVLLNRGVFRGGIQVLDRAAAINYGTMETGVFREWIGLWIEKDAVVVNEGTIRAYLGTSVWDGAAIYNLGEFMGYDLCLRGGEMLNFGRLRISGKHNGCVISRGSVLRNRGILQVLPGAQMYNYSRIENAGELIVRENAFFASSLLVNDGYFEAGDGAELGDIRGVYQGKGEYSLTGTVGLQNITRCKEAAIWENQAAFADGQRAAVVSNQEQLSEALADQRAAAVFTDAPINVSKDLIVEKPLLLFGDLTLGDGTELCLCGSELIAMEEAALSNAEIRLQDGGIVCGAEEFALRDCYVSIDENSVFRTKNADLIMERTWMENNGTVRLEGWQDDSLDWQDSRVSGFGIFEIWKPPAISDSK